MLRVQRNQSMSAVYARCTSRQHNAHVTESRVVLYRWHPWHGRAVFVFGAVTKCEQGIFRCALEQADVARPLEVPQWMFDAVACCRIELVAMPSACMSALRELDRLLSSAGAGERSYVLQAEHLSLPDSGGAYATRERSTPARSADAVSSTADDSAVEEFSSRGSRARAAATCTVSQRAPTHAAHRAGGAR